MFCVLCFLCFVQVQVFCAIYMATRLALVLVPVYFIKHSATYTAVPSGLLHGSRSAPRAPRALFTYIHIGDTYI